MIFIFIFNLIELKNVFVLSTSFSGVLENGEKSSGGGVIQGTASEASLVALLSARARAIRSAIFIWSNHNNFIKKHVALALYLSIKRVIHFSKYKEEHPEEKLEDGEIMNKVKNKTVVLKQIDGGKIFSC